MLYDNSTNGKYYALYIFFMMKQLFVWQISWLLIYFATNEMYLYVSRFLCGFVGGAMFTIVPIYVIEISDTRIRGLLGSLLVLFCNMGFFFGLIVTSYLEYSLVPLVFGPLSVISLIGFSCFPETPTYLSTKGHYNVSVHSVLYLNVTSTFTGS